MSETANKQLDRHIFRRWHNLKASWRFVAGWLGLVAILIIAVVFQTRALGGFYLTPSPIAGGVYTEGMVGSFSNANPIYATSEVDSAVSRLVFSPLLTFDKDNQLIGDLATGWTSNTKATEYTVTLKKGLTWHDGKPITANDVVYTYKTIQNPDSKSPLVGGWTGVKIEKLDDLTVKFTLPNAYSPFPYSLTTGILPEHLLKNYTPEQLRSATFNIKSPVGSGPFMWKSVSVENVSKDAQSSIIRLVKFDNYNRGTPKLDGITIHTYATDQDAKNALDSKEVITVAGVSTPDAEINTDYTTTGFNLMSADMFFLKTDSPLLSETKVRQALVSGTNVPTLMQKIGYPAVAVREPLLKGQVGFDPAYYQASFNKDAAKSALDAAGWVLPPNEQIRKKEGKQLKLNLVYEKSAEFSRIVDELQKQWTDLGVALNINITQDSTETVNYLKGHDYDVLLYGINIGPDPDVYAYWHSSQIKNGSLLNLSNYKSNTADMALEAGRTRVDPKLRAAKYKPFLQAWQADAPAIGLYQPRYLYISNQEVYGLTPKTINAPADRFNDVHTWMINTARTQKQ
ncbi:MAG: peptide ABC transporter substrate-binding protein [Candidatus Saccharimonadales bacterium]